MIQAPKICKHCRKEYTPTNNRELLEKACAKCLKKVDRAIRELGWKPDPENAYEDTKIPGLFWVPGKGKKWKNLHRMKE